VRSGIRITEFAATHRAGDGPLTPGPSPARGEGGMRKYGGSGSQACAVAPTLARGSQPVGPQEKRCHAAQKVPEFPRVARTTRLSGSRSDKRHQNHVVPTGTTVASMEQPLAASQPGQQVVPATRRAPDLRGTTALSILLQSAAATDPEFLRAQKQLRMFPPQAHGRAPDQLLRGINSNAGARTGCADPYPAGSHRSSL
jgi:hypothetical protein